MITLDRVLETFRVSFTPGQLNAIEKLRPDMTLTDRCGLDSVTRHEHNLAVLVLAIAESCNAKGIEVTKLGTSLPESATRVSSEQDTFLYDAISIVIQLNRCDRFPNRRRYNAAVQNVLSFMQRWSISEIYRRAIR